MREPHPDWTRPTVREKTVTMDFWCPGCSQPYAYTYALPRVTDSVAKTALYRIRKIVAVNDTLTFNSSLLTSCLTLNTSNLIETVGLAHALNDLLNLGLIYDLQDRSFKLTFLGWVMIWYGPY